MSERKKPVEEIITEVLLRDSEAELRQLEPRFEGFVQSVLSRLDSAEAAEPERVLRADEASTEEIADAALLETEAFAPVLQAAFEAEISDLDWAAFGVEVDDAIDAEALAPSVAAALREEVTEAVAAREGDWASFTESVMSSLPAESVTVAELLTEATEAELSARDGEWRAFSARVFEAIDAEEKVAARASLEEQAVLAMKAEVESEVEAMAPAFGESFKKDVEKQIFKSGQQPDPWWTRAWAWVREMLSVDGAYGLAAAAATAVVLIAVTGLPPGEPAPSMPAASVALSGQVAVEQLSFEGDVTVMPEDGLTIVWLDDA